MNSQPQSSLLYYRLIALWVICEAMIGGIIHGLRIPVSGLVVGSCAIICICLIAWYVPKKGAILKATVIVAIFKMMLSPQAPLPAYIAVFFQGAIGELLFWNRKNYRIACILLAVFGLLESGLQRILVLTIVYGNDLWVAINDFFNKLTKQQITTNYSLWIGSAYVAIHVITGLIVGWWASVLPNRIMKWEKEMSPVRQISRSTEVILPKPKKRKRLKKSLFVVWMILIALYIQSYYRIGTPLLPTHIALKILIRSLIIVFAWIFIVGPLLKQALHYWLRKKQTRSQEDVKQVLGLLPATQQMVELSWKQSENLKGLKRLKGFAKNVLVNTFRETTQTIYILSRPIQTGKTTSLIEWSSSGKDVFGILTPVMDGKRVFMNAETKEKFSMEAEENEEALLVGKYRFSKKNFERAEQVIRDAINKDGWLVIDEIGPLELNGKGFSTVLQEVLHKGKGNLLLIVRQGLTERVKEYFQIENGTVVNNIMLVK